MKILKWLLVLVLVAVIAVAIGGYIYIKGMLPDYDGEIQIDGVSAQVDIIRDSWGVPHIFAQNQEDAYFALGYCMAQDRIVQMEMMRLMAYGRLSELMGEPTVELDKLHRILLSAYDLQQSFEKSSPETRAIIEAFVRGINACISDPECPVPLEFKALDHQPEPFTMEDISAIIPFYAWKMSGSFRSELLRGAITEKIGLEMANELFVDHNEGYPTTIPEGESLYPGFGEEPTEAPEETTKMGAAGNMGNPAALLRAFAEIENVVDSLDLPQIGAACNSLVVSGEKTESGKPILAQDYHLFHSIPSALYEAHLATPTFKVAGYIFAGQPYVLGGQNEHVSWVFTNGGGDEIDFYLEGLHPYDPNKYLYKGSYEDMEVREETIKVKGGEDVKFTVRLTRHGPIIDDLVKDILKPNKPNTAFSVRMAAADSYTENEALYQMNTAKNADEFVAGASLYRAPGQHWIYADDNGEIGYFYGAAIPIRKGFDGTVPVPGWTGEYEWQGYVPAEEQPQVRNPKMGFINTSNAQPAPKSYPYHLGHGHASADRLTRVREIINDAIAEGGKFSCEDVDTVFSDTHLLMAREQTPLILAAMEGESLSPNERKALENLSQWDYMSDKESVASLIFQTTTLRTMEKIFLPHLEKDLYAELLQAGNIIKGFRCAMNNKESSWFDNPKTEEPEGRSVILAKSFREAVAKLEKEMGPDVDSWVLGDRLTLTLKNPISKQVPALARFADVGPLRMGGGMAAPFAIYYDLAKPYEVVAGTQARFVVDFSDRKNCQIVNMPGISGNFLSPYYDDQVKMWYKFKMRPLMLHREEAEKDAEHVLTMLPK